jgi:hypothetical protein
MTPDELARELTLLISGIEESFTVSIGRVQETLYRRLSSVLKNLEIDSEGYILQSGSNRTILREAENIFDEVIKSGPYQKAVSDSLSIVPQIDALNQSYFATVSDSFKLNRAYLKSLQQSVISDLNQYLLQDGLTASVKIPLNQILRQNVNSGGSFSGMLNQLRKFSTGQENEGKLLRYSRGILTDTLFNYARAYQESVTRDLNLDWYLYSGGATGKGKGSGGSREFCLDRMGRYYHRKEIESWASLEWSGKNKDTTKSSIFIYAGGHNCKHSLIPVHLSIVPKEDQERAEQLGFVKLVA